jgi:hypothetical protein
LDAANPQHLESPSLGSEYQAQLFAHGSAKIDFTQGACHVRSWTDGKIELTIEPGSIDDWSFETTDT